MNRDEQTRRNFMALTGSSEALWKSRYDEAQARISELEYVIKIIGRRTRSDGNWTLDDCIRELGMIDDFCRAAIPQEGIEP